MPNSENDNPSGHITFRCSATWQLVRKLGALFYKKKD